MKYLKSYKLFESDESDPNLLYDTFGVTYEQIGDVIRELLDVKAGLQYKVKVRLKGTEIAIFKSIDSFVIFIESENILSSLVFRDMIEQVDNYLSIYGLEVFYVSPLSERALGMNIFVKRIADNHKIYNNKLPEIDDAENKYTLIKKLSRIISPSPIHEEIAFNKSQRDLIEDIFLPLVDKGYKFNFAAKDRSLLDFDKPIEYHHINLFNSDINLKFDDIKDDLEFAINYIEGEMGIKIGEITFRYNNLNTNPNYFYSLDDKRIRKDLRIIQIVLRTNEYILNESKILEEFNYDENKIKDLFIDLTDNGVNVNIENKSNFLRKRCTINISTSEKNLYYLTTRKTEQEIKEILEFAINYIREELHMRLDYIETHSVKYLNRKYKLLDDINDISECYSIDISFKPYY